MRVEGAPDSGRRGRLEPALVGPSIPVEAVRKELEKVLLSQVFSGSERLCQFLRFVVEQSLSGQVNALKEWLLGVRVFGRSESFDPRVDAIVRVEAGRLRTRLAQYYQTEGQNDPILILVQKGGYAPVFHARSSMPREIASTSVQGLTPAAGGRKDRVNSIIVLPFLKLSADPENEFFADGLTEEITTELTQIDGLRVIARSTAFQYKGHALDVRRLRAELDVSAALEGSVRRAGDRLRITAQLVDTRDCFHLWSQTWERPIDDIFAIQREVAEAIVGVVRKQVPCADPARDFRDGSGSEAYELYLRAMYFEGKRTVESLTKELEQLTLAAEMDSRSAPIFASLSTSHLLRAVYGLETPKRAIQRARDAASKALEIDNTSAQAHAAKGFVTALSDWDWPRAGLEFRRALELNPDVPEIHHRYAVFYLSPLGKTSEALWHIKLARHLDPMSLMLQAGECAVLVWGGQNEAAIAKGRKILELEPTCFLGHLYLSWAYLKHGMLPESVAAAEEAVRLSAENPPALSALGNAFASTGQAEKAHQVIQRMRQRPLVPSAYIASVYSTLGEIEEAFHWLARAQRERSPALFSLRIGLVHERLLSDPRFEAVARNMGLGIGANQS